MQFYWLNLKSSQYIGYANGCDPMFLPLRITVIAPQREIL